METLSQLPLPFFLSFIALLGFGMLAWQGRYQGWGLPMGMVLGTIAVWYLGDAFYNDYEEYRILIGERALEAAWWQVLLFVTVFGMLVAPVHRVINVRQNRAASHLMRYMETRRLEHPVVQRRIDRFAILMTLAWVVLMAIALVRVKFDFIGLFAPYLGEKAFPWSRGRLGGGIDAILSLAGYIQVFLAAGFGVLAAVARRPKTRGIAIAVCFLTFPFFIFDRTRNTMLATMLPGILAWILFRVKGGLPMKGFTLLVAFLLINFWFGFVLANRTGKSITSAIHSERSFEAAAEAKHLGLNMFSELGYMNDLVETGVYQPKVGERYLAELANPVPRALWKNKPTVGIDYAIARGFGVGGGTDANAGVAASIATGMIGQGVTNFGRFFGPIAAALLMSVWVAIIAKQDLLGADPARMLLYAVGMILTFNMGRDITLLVVYPFVFGWMMLKVRDWYQPTAAMPLDAFRRRQVGPKRRDRQSGRGIPRIRRGGQESVRSGNSSYR